MLALSACAPRLADTAPSLTSNSPSTTMVISCVVSAARNSGYSIALLAAAVLGIGTGPKSRPERARLCGGRSGALSTTAIASLVVTRTPLGRELVGIAELLLLTRFGQPKSRLCERSHAPIFFVVRQTAIRCFTFNDDHNRDESVK